MVMASQQSVPLDQVLPVLLANMPMKSDFTENTTAFTCLMGLVAQRLPEVQANMLQVVSVCAAASHESYELDDELQAQIDAVMTALFSEFKEQMAGLCSQLQPELQPVVVRWAQQ